MRNSNILSIKVLSFLILFSTIPDLKAQSNWEIGARYGNYFAVDMTIPIASLRLHPAVYIESGYVAMGAYFDWLFALQGGPTGLKFYPGVGPEFYFYDGLDLAVAGNFGVEYSFDFPLTIGFDWRPSFMITNEFNYYGGNWGIIARFRFGEGTKFVKAK